MLAPFQSWWYRNVWSPKEFRAVNLEDPNTPINGFTIGEALGATPTSTGESINEQNALELSAVWACVRVLSGAISTLPLQVFEKTNNGRRLATDHPIYPVMTNRMGGFMYNKSVFLERAILHFLLWGNHLAEIKKNGIGNVTRLRLIHPSALDKIIVRQNSLVYSFKEENNEYQLDGSKVIHVPHLGDGLIGKGVIQNAREDLGLEKASQKYGGKFFKSGGNPQTGVMSTDKQLTQEQAQQVKDAYQAQATQGGMLVISNGFKYQQVSIAPEDAQFLQTRQFGVNTIARWFGVPVEKIQQMDRATYNNIEHNAIAFLTDTILPIIGKLENEYNNKLLTKETEVNHYFEFNIDAYLRADSASKAEMYRTLIQNGIMSINEVREKQNLNIVDGGEKHWIQQNMMPIETETNQDGSLANE